MICLRIRLHMKSPVATPWQADTIWGHLAWGLRYTRGEAALNAFIGRYRDGQPPLLVSDGFPGDSLPRPLAPGSQPDMGKPLAEQVEAFAAARERRRPAYVTADEFSACLRGEELEATLLPRPTWRAVLKNQVSRTAATAGAEGGTLYSMEELWLPEVTIYALADDEFIGEARTLFEYLALEGYGKRRSVGYGAVRSLEVEEFGGFDSPEDANGFVSLSSFVPGPDDPTNGFWQVFVKYGRLGEEYAYGPNPFKKPLLMLAAGSAFYDSSIRPFYGSLVEGVSPAHPEVVHFGYALPVAMKLPEEGAEEV